ncbi:MAG: DUF4129 domain-containing protein [Anaerolineae bacterium]|nr:DUF4129 domain-containing protein [Anaerolineae bacterium]
MNWRRWHWLNDIVLPLLTVLMRLCWLWPWLLMLQRWLTPSRQSALLASWLIIGIPLGSMAMTRWVLQRNWTIRQARVCVAGTGLLVLMLVLWWEFFRSQYPLWDIQWLAALGQTLAHWQQEVPPPFLALLVSAYLWLRGVLDGRNTLMHDHVWGTFIVGFLILSSLLLAGTADPHGLPPYTEQWVLTFFAVGMAALALSSLEIARRGGRESEEQPNLSRYWLISVLSVILALLGIGLLISLVITPATITRVLSWTSILMRVLGIALYYVFYVFVYVVFLFLTPLLNWLHSLLGSAPRREPMQMPNFQKQLEQMSQQPAKQVPPAVSEAARWLGVIGLITVIALAFALALRRFWAGEGEEIDETRELILSRDLLQEQLASLWRSWASRFRRAPRAALSPFLSLEGEPEPRRVIRELYQALLAAAKEHGHPRRREQTPIEYQRALSDTVPGSDEPLNEMTTGYIQARYGSEPPTSEQVTRVRRAWERLRDLLKDQGPDTE